MNNRNGLIAAGVVAVLAMLFALIQSSNLSQTQTKLVAIQTAATSQAVSLANQATAAVATLSAAGTQAADTQQKAVVGAGNAAATTQANALSDAGKLAATAQAQALGEAVNAASTTQAQALAAASQAAAMAQADALKDAAEVAGTAQAKAVMDAKNAAATQQAGATATLGVLLHIDATRNAQALVGAQNAAATMQVQGIATVRAQATATLGAVMAQAATERVDTQLQYQVTAVAVQTQIAAINAELATAQANAARPTVAATGISSIKPTAAATGLATAESTEQTSAVPADWKRYVGKGVAIQLPKTYIGSELGTDPQALSKMLRALGPDFASAATLLETNPDILSLIAINTGNGDKNLTANVIILSIPLPSKIPMDLLLEATINQLPSGSKVLEKSIVPFGEYEAGRMVVETHVGGLISTQLQYYIMTNDTLYLVGFTGAPNNFDAQLPLFEQSMKTFEILAKPGA